MKSAGKLVLVVAVLLGGYAILLFDPTVSAGDRSVVNLHKLSIQQNLLIVAAAGAVVGTLLLVFGSKGKSEDDAKERPTNAPFSRVNDAEIGIEEVFLTAIRTEDLATIRRFLSNRSVSPRGQNRNGRGWLQYAAVVGAIESSKILMEHGASPNDKDDMGTTALAEAVRCDSKDLVAIFNQALEARKSGL